jgi:hypothetical protein
MLDLRPDSKRSSWASLQDIVIWVAFQLPPLEGWYHKLEKYPSLTDKGRLPLSAEEFHQRIENAKDETIRAIIQDRLVLMGRRTRWDHEQGNLDQYVGDDSISYHQDEWSAVPKKYYNFNQWFWLDSRAAEDISVPFGFEAYRVGFIDLGVSTEALYAAFPLKSPETPSRGAMTSTARRGRKPQYDPLEFMRLCALEADMNGLPEHQQDLVARMQELLLVLWGERATPGETWLKEQVRALYALRESFERGRQALEGKPVRDRK